MFDFIKSKFKSSPSTNKEVDTSKSNEFTEPTSKESLFTRLKKGLFKTRNKLQRQFEDLFLGKKEIDENLLNELEDILLGSDIGVSMSEKILEHLTNKLSRNELTNIETLKITLSNYLIDTLLPCEKECLFQSNEGPFVVLMVGVNGAGKTTTIGKIAKKLSSNGKKVMLAAGDTYRAAAIEQLKVWGARNNIPVISQEQGSDSAAVIHDTIISATAKKFDVVLADTAGRLHTQDNLMNELEKVVRVANKTNKSAPHEIMLIIDASIGQNALSQVKKFSEKIDITSLAITKLDGTAKGGIIFAIADMFKLPIRYIGVGEKIEDLQSFNAKEFVKAVFLDVNN